VVISGIKGLCLGLVLGVLKASYNSLAILGLLGFITYLMNSFNALAVCSALPLLSSDRSKMYSLSLVGVSLKT